MTEGGKLIIFSAPSGSGKTTLLNLLGALERPDEGSISFRKEFYSTMNNKQASEFRCHNIGFIFQAYHLLPELNVLENVILPGMLAGTKRKLLEERGRDLLDQVGLSHRLIHHPAELSGGEQQRAAVARALIGQPEVLLADEPTGNLDRESGRLVIDALISFKEAGKTVVVVTHDPEIAALGDMQLALQGGALATTDALVAQ